MDSLNVVSNPLRGDQISYLFSYHFLRAGHELLRNSHFIIKGPCSSKSYVRQPLIICTLKKLGQYIIAIMFLFLNYCSHVFIFKKPLLSC